MIALVDGNNFYVSCERIFNPSLENKPTGVMSNNYGCIISRSIELKDLQVKMGTPYYQIKDLAVKHGIQLFSSNYTLYADISSRFMSILREFGVTQEVYSIDESFLDITGIADLTNHGHKICNTVKQYIGLPVCVGMGETKVLAKFANHLAKKYKGLYGVCNLSELGEGRVNKAMGITDVKEVWGIGRRTSKKLYQMGIQTVLDLKLSNKVQIRNIFNINIEKIVSELNGTVCFPLEAAAKSQKHIVSSRSFAHEISDYNALLSSLCFHIERAAHKLRKQGLFVKQLTVFIVTNRFKDDYCSSSKTIELPQALDSFRYLSKHVEDALKAIYNPSLTYKKSGVMLSDLITADYEQSDLFGNTNIRHDHLIQTLDGIKNKYEKSTINLAAAKLNNDWHMRQDNLSKRFTSDINELLVVE